MAFSAPRILHGPSPRLWGRLVVRGCKRCWWIPPPGICLSWLLYLHIRYPRFLHIPLAWNRHLRFWVTLVETASKVPAYRLRHALNCCAWPSAQVIHWNGCSALWSLTHWDCHHLWDCVAKSRSCPVTHEILVGLFFPTVFPHSMVSLFTPLKVSKVSIKCSSEKKLNKKTYKFTVSHVKGFTVMRGFESWAFIFVGANKILSDIQNRISYISHSSSTLSTFQINKLKNFRIKRNIQSCWKWTTPTNFLNTMDFLLCCAESLQSCPTLCNPTDHLCMGILQARILEWVAMPSPGDLPTLPIFFPTHICSLLHTHNILISEFHHIIPQFSRSNPYHCIRVLNWFSISQDSA